MATSAQRPAKRARSTAPETLPEPPCAPVGMDRFARIIGERETHQIVEGHEARVVVPVL